MSVSLARKALRDRNSRDAIVPCEAHTALRNNIFLVKAAANLL